MVSIMPVSEPESSCQSFLNYHNFCYTLFMLSNHGFRPFLWLSMPFIFLIAFGYSNIVFQPSHSFHTNTVIVFLAAVGQMVLISVTYTQAYSCIWHVWGYLTYHMSLEGCPMRLPCPLDPHSGMHETSGSISAVSWLICCMHLQVTNIQLFFLRYFKVQSLNWGKHMSCTVKLSCACSFWISCWSWYLLNKWIFL